MRVKFNGPFPVVPQPNPTNKVIVIEICINIYYHFLIGLMVANVITILRINFAQEFGVERCSFQEADVSSKTDWEALWTRFLGECLLSDNAHIGVVRDSAQVWTRLIEQCLMNKYYTDMKYKQS